MTTVSLRISCLAMLFALASIDSRFATAQPGTPIHRPQVTAPGLPAPERRDVRKTKIYPLKNSKAEAVADVLRQMLPEGPESGDPIVSLGVEDSANALILSAREEVLEKFEAIILQLDSPELHREPQDQDANRLLQVYHLKYAQAQEAAKVLSNVLPVHMAVDARTNSLILQASPQQLDSVRELIQVLDTPERREPEQAEGPAGQQRRLSFYWLASGPEFYTKHPIPPQLVPVVAELERIGIENVQLVSRSVAALDGSQVGFENTIRSGERSFHLVLDGRFASGAGATELPKLAMTVRANEVNTANESSVQTTVTTPYDHFVVLGVTGLGDLENAFVIQIQSVEPAGGEAETPSRRR